MFSLFYANAVTVFGCNLRVRTQVHDSTAYQVREIKGKTERRGGSYTAGDVSISKDQIRRNRFVSVLHIQEVCG